MLRINGIEVPVTGAPGLAPELLDAADASPKLKDWAASIDPSITVGGVTVLSVVMFGKNVGFLFIDAKMTKDGKFVPGVTFIRGDSVAMLVVLDCEGELYTPLTVQPRSPIGAGANPETAAGMVDAMSFVGAAAKEMQEELGFTIPVGELVNLREAATGESGPVSISPGGCDEQMMFYAWRRSITRDELEALQGKLTGELGEGETITLNVVPLFDLMKIPDAKTIIALSFYKEALERGTL